MLNIIIAPGRGNKEIDLDSLKQIKELADNDSVIFIEPSTERSFFRDNIIQPLLDDNGFLKKEVYDFESVYRFDNGDICFDYCFSYLPNRIKPFQKGYTPEELPEDEARVVLSDRWFDYFISKSTK